MKFINSINDVKIFTEEELDEIYRELKNLYDKYLKKHGVKIPLKKTNKYYQLLYLYKNIQCALHKDLIAEIVSLYNNNAGRDQQVRHLAADGWYVLNKNETTIETKTKIPSGYHVLMDVYSPKPTFLHKTLKRLNRIDMENFEQLKIWYSNCCATCGCVEGTPHRLFPDKIVELQQGHMDPNEALTLDNTIPQCQICNAFYLDNFVFDDKGRIKRLNNPNFILKSDEKTQKEVLELLNGLFLNE